MENFKGIGQFMFRGTLVVLAGSALTIGCTVTSADKDEANKGGATSVGGEAGQPNGNGGAAGQPSSVATGGVMAANGGTTAAAGVNAAAGNGSGLAGAAGSAVAANGGASGVGGSAGASSVGTAGQAGAPAVGSNPCSAADAGNDTRELSTPYVLGTQYLACLQSSADVDYYEFTAPASPINGGVVQVSLIDVAATGSLDSSAYVVADNGELQNSYGTGGTNVYYWFGVVAGAKYRISVQRFSSSATAVAYTLKTVYVPVNDTHEPNDLRSAAAPISVATDVQGYFFAGYSVSTGFVTNAWEDWYKVTLAAGNVTVTVDNMASDINGEIELYNSLGTSVKDTYSATDGSTVVMTQTGVTAGDYYLKVTPFSGKSPRGSGSVLPQYLTQPYLLKVTQ